MSLGTVILVPGFLGSYLYRSLDDAFKSFPLWMNPPRLILGGLERLQLPVAGEPPPAVTGPDLLQGTPIWSYYGPLGRWLDYVGWRVVSPSADWRRTLSFDGDTLTARIRKEAANGPVNVICHSRGGLLTRYALGQLAATGDAGLVRRVIGLGVPHTGSLSAVALLGGWHSLVGQLETMGNGVFNFFSDSLKKQTILDVIRSWPAAYELLPSPDAQWVIGPSAEAFYQPATWATSPARPVAQYLADAHARWASLPPVPQGFDWIDVAGYGLETYKGVEDNADLSKPGSLRIGTAGDATVPVASAHQVGRRVVMTPTKHDWLPNDGRLWGVIHDALQNGLSDDLTIAGTIVGL